MSGTPAEIFTEIAETAEMMLGAHCTAEQVDVPIEHRRSFDAGVAVGIDATYLVLLRRGIVEA